MAERVRRFRVKNASGHADCGVKNGDVSTLVKQSTNYGILWIYLASLPHWHKENEPDGSHVFKEYELEELPTFQVGDAVRVKAGSPKWANQECGKKQGMSACESMFGKKLTVHRLSSKYDGFDYWEVYGEGRKGCDGITENYLEPWNDAEEWNGSEWVAKKPKHDLWHEIVKAFFTAESPNPESAPKFEEKGSRRVEVKPEPVKFTEWAFVRAVRDTKCDVLGTPVAKGQIVRVVGEPGVTLFNGSPLPGNSCPALRIADFELVT